MNKKTKRKNARYLTQPTVSKKTAYTEKRPNFEMTIGWNFDRMDDSGKFACSLKALDPYTSQLVKLEGLKIRDLLNRNRHNHPISLDKLSRTAQERIRILDIDEETLFQPDLKTPVRLWGVLEQNIFHILWLDPTHEVYPSR